jgi:hypothetical protein
MTFSDYENATGDRVSLFDHSRLVWVVTVHAPGKTVEEGYPFKVHSAVLDAATGLEVRGCRFCAILHADGSLVRPSA